MKRFPRTLSPSSLRVFTSCLLSFLMLLSPVATLAGSVKMAETAAGQRQLTVDQKTEAFLFNAPPPAATPDMSATMTDSFADGDADSKAEFGETITYTADIKNNGPVDATGVKFDAALDPNTDIVPGSVKFSPVALNDSYLATKDTPLNSGTSVITNDTGQPAPTVSAVVGCADVTAPFDNCATTQGGEVDMNADGTFTYTPASGFEGSDTFKYTLSNGQTAPNPGVDDTATVTISVDAAPTVTSTTPTNAATGVDPSTNITINFSESVNVTANAFTVECPAGSPVTFTTSASPASSFTLNPSADLPGGTTCTVHVESTEVTDVDSNDPPDNMAADYDFTFTTDAAPAVTTTSPTNGTNGVATNVNIVVNFTENINANANSFKIECPAPGNLQAFTYTGASTNTSVITLNPTADLPAGTTCTVTVVALQISDSDAFDPPDKMAADYVFSFTTDAAPSVTTTTPTNGATNLPTNTAIQINFSENVNATTSSFKIECPAVGNLQTFTLSASPSNTFTLTPTVNLPGGTTCTVTVIALQISDQDGNDPPDNMVANYVFSFSTDAAPVVTATTPTNGATKQANNTDVTVTFSESVGVTGNWFQIVCGTSGTHDTTNSSVSGGPATFTINPTDFANGETCTGTVFAAQVEDTDTNDPPNNPTANYVWTFTIDTPPSVTTTTPTNGATGVAANVNIVVNFDENINANANSFKIECPTPGNLQAFAYSGASTNTNVITLNPTSDLPIGVQCTVTVVALQISDADAGDPPDNMTADYVFTFKIPPVANDDTHPQTVIGNVNVNSANIPFSVTSNNDLFSNADPVTIDKVQAVTAVVSNTITATTAQGGTVVMTVSGADMGKYLYNPPAGYEGGDTFTYQITNGGGSDSATVSLPISGMVWFINNTAGAGDGRLSSPFNSLAAFQAVNNGTGNNPAASDNIFIYESATAYEGPVTLLSNQRLFGQDSTSSLATLTGLNPPSGSASFPVMNSGNGTITKLVASTAATNAVNLNATDTGNTINGLTIGNTTGSAINGATFGTLTVGDIRIDEPSSTRTGQALNLVGGPTTNTDIVNGTFAFVEASGGTGPGIVMTRIDSATGINFSGGSLSGLSGTDFDVDLGNANITFDATITNTAGRAVDVTNKTAGTVDFNGAISDNGGTGVNLQSNTSSLIRFDGGLTLATPADSFVATQNGTLAITGSNNTINSTSGTALNVAFTNIHTDNLNFKSISAGNATAAADPVNGIILNTTGTTPGTHGKLTIAGNGNTTQGGDNSGGTIQNTTGNAVSLTSTLSPTFTNFRILTTGGHGISGTQVVNFSFTYGTITSAGNGAQESAISFSVNTVNTTPNITGTLTVTNSNLTNMYYSGIDVQQSAGTVTNANLSDNTITSTTSGATSQGFGINFNCNGTATSSFILEKATINNNTITNFPTASGIQINGGNSSASGTGGQIGFPGDINKLVSITNNKIAGLSQAVPMNGSAIIVAVAGGNSGNRSKFNVNISTNGTVANPITNVFGTVIGVAANGYTDGVAVVDGNRISANQAANVGGGLGIGGGAGVAGAGNAWTPDMTYTVTNNVISGTDGNGILIVNRQTNGSLDLKIANNNVGAPVNAGGTARYGIRVDSGNTPTAGEDTNVCLNIFGNTSAGSNGATGIGVRKEGIVATTNDFGIQGISQAAPTNAQVEAYITSQNPGASGGGQVISGSNFVQCSSAPAFYKPATTNRRFETAQAVQPAKLFVPGLDIATAHGVSTASAKPAAVKSAAIKPAAQKAAAPVALSVSASEPVKIAKAVTPVTHAQVKRTSDEETFTSHASLKPRAQAPAAKVQPVAFKTEPAAEAHAPAAAKTVTTSKALTAAPAAVVAQPAAPPADLPVTIGTLPAGKKVRVTFQVTVKSAANYTGTSAIVSAQGTVTFDDPNNPPTGTLSVLTDDTGTGANTGETDPTTTPVDSQPDLFLSKSDGGASVVPGGTISYTLTYNNTNGKRTASGVVITETVPANTTFNAGASSAGWVCTPNNNAGSTCTLSIPDLVAGDAGGTKTFAVTVLPALPAGVTGISNTATIADDGSKGADGNPTDNTGNDTTPVNANSDLSILKSDGGVGVQAGNTVTYTLSYSNIGNKGATGVVITETVPADTTFNAGASTAGWVCAPNNNAGSTCTISIGAVAAGGSGSVTFAVTTSATPVGTEVSNTASIDDDNNNGPDPSGNDSSSDTTPFDDVPTLGTYSDTTILVTQGTTVSPTAPPADDNPGFDTDVTVSAGFTGGATVNDTTGVVTITNAAPAGVYTVTVTTTDSTNQTVTRQFQLTVNKSDTTTALASNKNPSFNNQNVTFTATVTSNTAVTGPPTGTVDFFDGATLICNDAPLDGAGKATCSTSTLDVPGSPHSITATYNGDALFLTSTSSVLSQVVNPSLNIEVNTTGDESDLAVADEICDVSPAAGEQCTLRAAIETANFVPSDDIITFNSSLNNQTITLNTALPVLGDNASSGNLTITGLGATHLKVQRDSGAATQFRVFTVPAGKTVTISGLTISGGDSALDGGGVANSGTLTLNEVVVSGNSTDNDGGGVRNDTGGVLTIKGSTISGNTATILGGGVRNSGTSLTITESTITDNEAPNGGGIANSAGTLTLTNSTISGNRAKADGGGLRNSGGTATLTNVTVTDNRADSDSSVGGVGGGVGGGIRRVSGTVTLSNTIVAENFNDANPANTPDDISGTVTGTFNLIGAGGAGTLVNGVNGNQVGVDPKLHKLLDNGGPTKTHALKNNSPALDAGDNTLATNAGLTEDQRGPGFNRFVDSSDPGTVATVDIGAFEAQVTIEDISNKGSAEDTTLSAFNFEVTEDPGISGFTVTATSSDTTLVPNANLTLGGAGSTRTLSITPAPDKFGTTTITVTVSGLASGVFPVEMTDTFDFDVSPVADTPDAADVGTDEDTVSGPIAVTKNPVDGAEVTHFRVTGITGGRLYMPDGTTEIAIGQFIAFTDAAPGLRFQPTANSLLPGHFKVQGATGNILAALGGGQDTSTISIGEVNDPPTLASIVGVNVLEDSGLATVNFQNVTAGVGETQVLTVTATSSNPSLVPNPTVNYTSPDSTGSLSFTPVANGFGSADITVTVKDNGTGTLSVSRTFTVNVIGVNDPPSFTKGADQTVAEDSGAQTVPTWATAISAGPDETAPLLGFVVTGNTNPALFAVQPAVSPTGTLTYTPAANATGTTQITLVLKDFQLEENGGSNTSSPPQTFNITVNPVNDAPTLNVITDKVYNEDSGLQTVNISGITIGPNESGQTLNVTASSNNTSVVPNPTVNYTSPNAMGSLSFTPVADANGTATITVTVQDSGGGTDTFQRTFMVTVREMNDAPTGVNDALPIGNEDVVRTIPFSTLTGNDSKGPSNESGQTLTITAVNGPTGGSVTISGTDVIFTPTLNYSGPASFNYTLRDNGTTAGADNFKTSTAQVTFNVKAVNDAPVNQVPGPQTTVKNSKILFTSSNGKLIRVTDADVGTDTMKLVLQVSRGTVTLFSITGLTFTTGDGTDDNYMVFTGTLADINNALKGMRFTPQTDFVGAGWIKITSNDLGHSPAPALTDADTVAITIENAGSQPVDAVKAGASTFQLSAPTYTVSEGGQRATVTVKRSGDLSAPAAVSYATSDLSGLGACGLTSGNASARCDYAVGAGTLRFAAGQSSKAVTVPLVNDVYKEGPENFTLSLTKSVGGKLGEMRSATVTIADDDDGAATASPISSDEFFVRQLYLDYLGREPDAKGLSGWLDLLKNCAGKDCGREAVAASFSKSQEFKERTYFAFSLYRASLGRTARYDELVPDAARLNSARTDAELLENKADYVADFMGREEFKARYESLADADYVDALLVAAALPNHPQRAAWVEGLAGGSLSRGDVLRQFAESAEVSAKFADEAEAVTPYLLLLRRSPDAVVGERGALLKTGDLLQNFAGFLNSDEYRKRVGP